MAVNTLVPANWYWIVGGSTTQVWSSAALAYAPSSDPTYLTWAAISGNVATAIGTTTLLSNVVTANVLPIILTSQGLQIISTGTPALNATYGLDDLTVSQIHYVALDSKAGFTLPQGAGTFSYPDIAGTAHSFTATNIQNLYIAIRDYISGVNTGVAANILAGSGSASVPAMPVTIA